MSFDRRQLTEAELAQIRAPFGSLDQASADARRRSAFGVQPVVAEKPSWRTGPPGRLTEAESRGNGWLPVSHTHEQYREHQRKQAHVEETRRQIAIEQKVLSLASQHGWDWLRTNTDGHEATIVESVRQRLGGGTAAQLQESAGAALVDAGVRVHLQEATAVAPRALSGRRIAVTLITPGWGSSGHYSAAVLEQAARDNVFAKGLPIYLDHPTQRELNDRPERSVRDLAGALTHDARWTGSALEAEAEVLPQHSSLLAGLQGVAGMSIRASADVSMGEAEGRRGRIVGRIVEAQSVDVVTRAGRGGTFRVLESERPRWGG